ncbi:MAG: DUF2797 domain-containing protein [Crocinitomicaceae bacterium TMED114]|nr:MAG: DUF2797 domain-containing protein [Crocinitomicaceae bacterium TMED114]
MEGEGNIRKLKGQSDAENVRYDWCSADILDGQKPFDITTAVGQEIRLSFLGHIHCTVTGKRIRKTYGDGMSFDAFQSSPLAVESIIRPELSRIHEGIALRDAEWEERHHNQPHTVYLSATSGIKVGVTRDTNIPSRWIDQGASGALILARTPYRQLAGLIEVDMKAHFADKTQWRAMLTAGNPDPADVQSALLEALDHAFEQCPPDYEDFLADEDDITHLHYPATSFPDKVKSVKLDTTPELEGRLTAIKGQYLMFEDGRVFNVRRHSGYRVHWSFGS